MTMEKLDRDTLTTTLDYLEEMSKTGLMEPEWYHKALVDGAHQYLLAKELGQVLMLIGKVPVSYFSDVISGHMEADPAYADQVFEIATVLVNNNLVHLGLGDIGPVADA